MPSPARRSGTPLIVVLAFAGVVVAVMQTLVVPLLTQLPDLLHAPSSDTAWVITVTLLTGAVATPVLGRLGDMHGKRRMLLVAVSLIVLGSLVCACTSSLLPMMAGRALQGGAIGAIPLGISIMRDELPPERLGSAMGLMSSSLGIGGALALPVAAIVAEHFDWHTLFLGSAALGVVSFLLVLKVVPESPLRAPGRFDLPGALGLSAGLVLLLLAISKGGDWGWDSGPTLGCFGAAALVLLGWGAFELRVGAPLVDLRTTARPQVLLTNLASILVGFALYATQLIPPQLLQLPTATGYGLGQSMVAAGLCVAPLGVAMMLVSPVGARLIATRGPKTALLAGIVVLGVAYALGVFLLHEAWQIVLFSALAGIGVGLAYASMPTLIIGAVPATETAAANGLNTLMRSIGTSSSSAVVGMVLAHLTQRFGAADVPTMTAFRTAFLIGCVACVAAAAIAAFIPAVRGVPRGIGGRITDSGGEPVPAECTVVGRDGHEIATVHADDDGRYAVDTEETGDVVLLFSAAGARPEAAPVRLDGRPVLFDLTLQHVGGVAGTVHGASDTVVAGALVIAVDGEGAVAGAGESDVDGRYAVPDLAPGDYVLAVSAAGHRARAVSVRVTETELSRDVVLTRASEVRGKVSAPDGSPMAGAKVVLTDEQGRLIATGHTGVDGRYAFGDLEPATYAVIVSGYTPVTGVVTVTGGVQRYDPSFRLEA